MWEQFLYLMLKNRSLSGFAFFTPGLERARGLRKSMRNNLGQLAGSQREVRDGLPPELPSRGTLDEAALKGRLGGAPG